MRRKSFGLIFCAFIAASLIGLGSAHSADTPSQFVSGFLRDAFAACRSTQNPVQVRETKLRDLFRTKLDIPLIARLTTNDSLTEAAPDTQRRFEGLLVDYLVQLYSLKIEDSADSTIEVRVEPPSPDGTIAVTTFIGKPGSPSEPIKWRLNASTGTFKIVDVIGGGISLVTLQREVFLAVLRRGGLPQLMTQLEAHAR